MPKILLVEDDLELVEMLETLLQSQGHTVECTADGNDAIHFLKAYVYDLILLDWQLPGSTGIDVCRAARSIGITTPILMLTAKSEISDKVTGLDTGADDYLTKPFQSKELLARIRSLLRRQPLLIGEVLTVGDLTLERDTHSVKIGHRQITLFPKEYELLEYFMRHPGQVFSQEDLLNRLWPSESETGAGSIRTHVYRLRAKLSVDGQECPIKTVHGVGYKLDAS